MDDHDALGPRRGPPAPTASAGVPAFLVGIPLIGSEAIIAMAGPSVASVRVMLLLARGGNSGVFSG